MPGESSEYGPVLTTAQVAKLLDLNPQTVQQMAKDGRPPAPRLTGARMTTADVAMRAGLSRGAQLYHFQSKAELVATAVDHLLDRMHAQFLDAVAAIPADVDRGPAIVDLLWQLVTDPTFVAWLELVM